MYVEAFAGEYRRYRLLAERATAGLNEQDWHRRLNPNGNSIATLTQHLAGNLASRFYDFLHTDGETSMRYRDREFDDLRLAPEERLAQWQAAWQNLTEELNALVDADLKRSVTIRRQTLTVAEALTRSVAHVAYHVGQIVLLAQWLQGPQWRSLSVPRGASDAYLQNPTLEKPPKG